MKFWIVENGNVLLVRVVPDPKIDLKKAKIEMVKAIIEAIKENQK